MDEYERVKKEIEEAIDYYDHWLAELVEDRQRELGNPKFMEITDLRAKAMGEAIKQILSLVEIRADKQEPPIKGYSSDVERMLAAGFIRVIPKPKRK